METIEGCDSAGVFLLEGDHITTPAHSDSVVAEIDAPQHRAGEGPCLDAITAGGTVYAQDLTADAAGRSSPPKLSPPGSARRWRCCSPVRPPRGALNLYAHYPHAFGIMDRAKAAILAAFAGSASNSGTSSNAPSRR